MIKNIFHFKQILYYKYYKLCSRWEFTYLSTIKKNRFFTTLNSCSITYTKYIQYSDLMMWIYTSLKCLI